MSIKEDIKMLLAKKAMTMTELAKCLTDNGIKSSIKSLSNKLSRQTIKFEEVRKIMDILGFDIEYKER
jgi:lambda repressor-like predicted transcriptional regulator